MAEFLVRAKDNAHADPDKDRAGSYKVGDLVVAMRDGHEWGRREGVPNFVIVKVPGLSLGAARGRVGSWWYDYDIETVQRSVAQDSWRFKVTNLERRADGAGTPKVENIRYSFERWGATLVRLDGDGVVLDWRVETGAASKGFLGADAVAVGVVIAETGYSTSSGWHTFRADWSAATIERPGLTLLKRVGRIGGQTLGVEAQAATYRLHRDSVRNAFTDDVKGERETYKRRRFALPADDVAAALGAGGVVTISRAQLDARVIDHRAG